MMSLERKLSIGPTLSLFDQVDDITGKIVKVWVLTVDN